MPNYSVKFILRCHSRFSGNCGAGHIWKKEKGGINRFLGNMAGLIC